MNFLGIIYKQTGDLKKALEFYNKSISINSKDINAYKNKGIIFHSTAFSREAAARVI